VRPEILRHPGEGFTELAGHVLGKDGIVELLFGQRFGLVGDGHQVRPHREEGIQQTSDLVGLFGAVDLGAQVAGCDLVCGSFEFLDRTGEILADDQDSVHQRDTRTDEEETSQEIPECPGEQKRGEKDTDSRKKLDQHGRDHFPLDRFRDAELCHRPPECRLVTPPESVRVETFHT